MGRSYKPGKINIGLRSRLGRFVFGLLFFVIGAWSWAMLVVNEFPPLSRVLLFVPFYLSFLGLYEAIFGFCVFHYRRHMHGKSRNSKERTKNRKRFLFIHIISIVSAVIVSVYFEFML